MAEAPESDPNHELCRRGYTVTTDQPFVITSLQVYDDVLLRRHSFQEVGPSKKNADPSLQTKRRNSSYPEAILHKLHHSRHHSRDGGSSIHHPHHHRHHHKKRHSTVSNHSESSKAGRHRHHHRRSSCRPEVIRDHKLDEEKAEQSPEQKTKRKIMMAVFVVTGFIVVVSVILVAVALQFSPKIDELGKCIASK
ncbi:Uncharacterised protein g8518 [Pycnogonum litorale]